MIKIKKGFTKTECMYAIIVILLVIVSTRFNVTPDDNMDIVRHFNRMRAISKSSMPLHTFLFGNVYTFTYNNSMKFCYSFNLIEYCIAKLFNNFYVITWLFIFLDYSIIAIIGTNWWKTRKTHSIYKIVFEMLLCYALLPYIHACSGLRMALAACIMALTAYLFLYKNVNLAVAVVLIILSITFHTATIFCVPFLFIAKYFNRKYGVIITSGICLTLSLFINFFLKAPISFVRIMAKKYIEYSAEDSYRGTRFCYFGVIIISLIVLAEYMYVFYFVKSNKPPKIKFDKKIQKILRKYLPDTKQTPIYDFIAYIMIFIICNIGNYEMVMRPGYVLGALAPVLAEMIFFKREKSPYGFIVMTTMNVILFIIVFYVSFKYFTYYSVWFR